MQASKAICITSSLPDGLRGETSCFTVGQKEAEIDGNMRLWNLLGSFFLYCVKQNTDPQEMFTRKFLELVEQDLDMSKGIRMRTLYLVMVI